ncbi:MAG: non-canonical purine NTP pyrophosphatase [Bacilli bacterium]|nr:non-canonical purine NTP pyrophosphatase [Bacilli bacterium]
MKITLVTGNWAKIAQAKEFLEPKGYEVDNIKMDTIEIQADSIEEVAKYSAKWASDELKVNIIKNDTGIVIDALNGFPAAYTHYVQDTIGEDGILKLMDGIENRKAKFVQALAYCEYGKEPVVFVSETTGTISKEKQGEHGWCWDFIFIPDGQTKTLACFEDSERFKLWNDTGYNQLIDYLEKQNNGIDNLKN